MVLYRDLCVKDQPGMVSMRISIAGSHCEESETTYSLSSTTRQICHSEVIDDELLRLWQILIRSGYSPRFINRNLTPRQHPGKEPTVRKKSVFLNIELNGDTDAEILNNWISKFLSKALYSAKLCIVFSTRSTTHGYVKDKLLLRVTSMCIYKFTCYGGAVYIDCTSLSKRISEHNQVWLLIREYKDIISSMQEHLFNSEYVATKEPFFRKI